MRARNLKPGFFKNEFLGLCTLAARTCFLGLTCLADREGRLEDRPRKIGAEVFPYDDFDVAELLDELASQQHKGKPQLIVRYSVNGDDYIQILNFTKHQKPHHNEVPSEIPPPKEQALATLVTSTCDLGNKHFALNPSSLNPSSLNKSTATAPAKQSPIAAKIKTESDLGSKPKPIITRKRKKLSGKKQEEFLRFWDAFGDKRGRAEAADAWLEIPDYSLDLVEIIVQAAEMEARARPGIIARNQTPKMAQGWLTARRWENWEEKIKARASPRQADDLPPDHEEFAELARRANRSMP